MIYPEGKNKVYSGKLISTEMVLDSIEERLEMSSFIILATGVLTLLSLLYNVVFVGFNLEVDLLTIVSIFSYFILFKFSYRFPLVCFSAVLIIYLANLFLNLDSLYQGSLVLMGFRIAIPIILMIGIVNVIYSWFKINEIKRKEVEHPEDVKHLIYVIKDTHIYNDLRFYNPIINNVDSVELEDDFGLLSLNNKEQYYNFNMQHNSYNKYCQIFLQKPIAESKDLVSAIFSNDLKNEKHILLAVLFNFKEEKEWEPIFIRKIEEEFVNNKSNAPDLLFTLTKAKTNSIGNDFKKELSELENKIRNSTTQW